MTGIVVLLAVLIIGGTIVALTHLFSKKDDNQIVEAQPTCDTCDGTNTKCEQECMMEAAVKDIVYFDDEELDAFAGRRSDNYSDEEAEQFAEVLYTMRPDEVPEWNRSLILRGINIPDQIKDEFLMLIDDALSSINTP